MCSAWRAMSNLMKRLFLPVLFAFSLAAAPATAQDLKGGGGTHRTANDCTTEGGGFTNEICLDDDGGAGAGLWRCPARPYAVPFLFVWESFCLRLSINTIFSFAAFLSRIEHVLK